MVASWEAGLGGWVKKVKGLRGTNWKLQNSHGDTKYSIGNIVSNIYVTGNLYSNNYKWCWEAVELLEGSLRKFCICNCLTTMLYT